MSSKVARPSSSPAKLLHSDTIDHGRRNGLGIAFFSLLYSN